MIHLKKLKKNNYFSLTMTIKFEIKDLFIIFVKFTNYN
jgi:hypothetical protein